MTTLTWEVFGIDPGPVPGIVQLRIAERQIAQAGVVQCDRFLAPDVLEGLLTAAAARPPTIVAIERFVVGRRAGRSATAKAGEQTRQLIGELNGVCLGLDNVRVLQRSASTVKPWATDERLDAAGLLDATKGMRHARDAARHALFAAVRDGGLSDPLIRKAQP